MPSPRSSLHSPSRSTPGRSNDAALRAFGVALFVALMAAGYAYNVTFVQLGLTDLGTRILGLEPQRVAIHMALLAVLTALVALALGASMLRRARLRSFRAKLRIAFAAVTLLTLLTALAPRVGSEAAYATWMVAASLALGAAVPATFGLATDLVPVARRGEAAAAVTAGAYGAALLLSGDWTLGHLTRSILPAMPLGVAALGFLAFGRAPWLERLAAQHRDPAFARGRFVGRGGARGRIAGLALLMFAVFFVDSLGFLRLVDTPALVGAAWRAPEADPRLALALTHALAAFAAGALYRAFGARQLFAWAFGVFALVHLMYVLDVTPGPLGDGAAGATLAAPLLYAVAVSLYTVLAFALWADLSTPRTVGLNAAVGIAAAGWSATFLSTALALRWQQSGVALEQHLRWVDALALLPFAALLLALVLPLPESREVPATHERSAP